MNINVWQQYVFDIWFVLCISLMSLLNKFNDIDIIANRINLPVPLNRPWVIWVNISYECNNNRWYNYNKTKDNHHGEAHERYGVSNNRWFYRLFNRSFRLTAWKTSKLRITDPSWDETTGSWWIPLKKSPWCGKRFISWRHHHTSVCISQGTYRSMA